MRWCLCLLKLWGADLFEEDQVRGGQRKGIVKRERFKGLVVIS